MKLLKITIPTIALLLVSCVTNPLTGKKEIDPSVRNALIDVAKATVAGIATSQATTGKVDWNLVAQGALSQVYSTTSTVAANRAIDIMIPNNPKLSGAVQTAVGSVVAKAKEKGLDESSAVVIGATFLDNELNNLKAP